MTEDLAVIALLIAAFALVAARLERVSIGSAMVFLAIGLLLSDHALGPISVLPEQAAIELLAELALTLLLFADASTLRTRALEQDWRILARLLGAGLLLTVGLGTLGAYFMWPEISFGLALLIGAALAPTDAALGQPVVSNPAVPARIRHILNAESGLNDGIATPIVFLAIGIATAEATDSASWFFDAIADVGIGVAAGVAVGAAGGFLLVLADARKWTSPVSRQLLVLALAIACYLVAVSFDGNGFIAAFVGGLAFGAGSKYREVAAIRFTEMQGSLLAIGVWAGFGLTVAGELLDGWPGIEVFLYAALSLTVIRMAPVALAMLGTGFRTSSLLFMGWFGPRGLASIVFLLIALEELEHAGVDTGPLAPAIAMTVLFSVVLHGLSAGPLAALYGRRAATFPPSAPEVQDASEPAPARTSWAGDAPAHPGAPPELP